MAGKTISFSQLSIPRDGKPSTFDGKSSRSVTGHWLWILASSGNPPGSRCQP